MNAGQYLRTADVAPLSASRDIVWAMASLPLAVLIIGCAGFTPANGGTLYKRLGGLSQIEAIVEESVWRAASVTERAVEPAYSSLPALRRNVVTQVCARSGGPCERLEAPSGQVKVSGAEFDAFVGSMRAVLDRRVAEREKNELLRLLAPIRREVVGA